MSAIKRLSVYFENERPGYQSMNFVEIVDSPKEADVIVYNSDVKALSEMKVCIYVGNGSVNAVPVLTSLLSIYRGMYHNSYLQYLIEETSTTRLCEILKTLDHSPGRSHYSQFYSKYTTKDLMPLRKEYAIKLFGIIKQTIEERKASFSDFISEYLDSSVSYSTEIVSGKGPWSPEMIFSYITTYMLWDIPQLTEVYNEYLMVRNGPYLRDRLKEYYLDIPEKKYCDQLNDLFQEMGFSIIP